ncbi:erythromycin esterase family protein [Aliicoccus persicus]|uniref:Erythromycin esterase n=1 Tax=Aliicoccus persicus TaxID=930138 RepID=A0A662Z5Q8_9STAP|nr:erythromycin esterase family protein [Aliicoccus persicus]SEW18919.1 Erythromycin esterase [Aliicoccus persicus]
MKRLALLLTLFLVGFSNEDTEHIYDLNKDWSELGNYFEEYDVIVLAESTHNSRDMTTLHAELALYLNEHHNFSTVAFEQSKDYWTFINQYKDSHSVEDVLTNIIDPHILSINPMLPELLETESLHVTGMNWMSRPSGQPTNSTFEELYITEDIEQFWDTADFKTAEYRMRNFTYDLLTKNTMDFALANETLDIYNTIINSDYFDSLSPESKAYIKERVNVLEGPMHEDFVEDLDISNDSEDYYARRGKGMLENIEELVAEDEKIIVYVHNMHASKSLSPINYVDDFRQDELTYSLGHFLEASDLNVLIVATIFNEASNEYEAFQGDESNDYGRKQDKRSVEYLLGEFKKDQFFVPLNSLDWADEKLLMYDFGHEEWPVEFIPNDHFDAFIYMDYIEK